MSETIPSWLDELAQNIYNIILKYNAIPRFKEMINEWAEKHQAEIDKLNKWNEQRRSHFEENVINDIRLQDKSAGPPEDGWQFELHIQHKIKNTEPSSTIINGWAPPELSKSKEPQITPLLPLSRDHELSLAEKYTVLATIYDYAHEDTENIPLWEWPGPKNWDAPNAISNAKKCISFEALKRYVPELDNSSEMHLTNFLSEVESDLEKLEEKGPIQTSSVRKATFQTKRKYGPGPPLSYRSRLHRLMTEALIGIPPIVFISYCREDRSWLVDIQQGLDPLIRQHKIRVWSDENIEPGQKWHHEIQSALESSKVALLLVSRNYLASDFINQNELPYLLDAYAKGNLKILWVLIGASLFEETPLKDIQAVIDPKYPLNTLSKGEQDIAIKSVCQAIWDAINEGE